MTPTYRLECHSCGRFLGMVPFPVLCTGSVRWAPQTDDGLIYLKCQCRSVSRYEVVPNLTQDELLASQQGVSSMDTQQHKAA